MVSSTFSFQLRPYGVSSFSVNLLKKLVLPDGSILRAQNPGRPTRDCLFADVGQDGTSALKIWNSNFRQVTSFSQANGGVVGAFNVQGVAWNFGSHENKILDPNPPQVMATIKPFDVETMRSHSGSFAVWSHREGTMNMLSGGGSTIEVMLDPHEWEIFTMEPIQAGEHVEWAPIGLGDMLNSGGAILQAGVLEETIATTNSTFGEDAGRWRHTTIAEVVSRGSGRFVAYSQPSPSRILVNTGSPTRSSLLPFSHDQESGTLQFTLPCEKVDAMSHQIMVVWDRYL
jgi:raffinose synthase